MNETSKWKFSSLYANDIIDKMELTHWNGLSKFGQNKLFRTSYYWLILVPIVVRFLEKIESPIRFIFAQSKLEFNINLPFSWKLFYIGAIFVSIGNIIYELFCPIINKKFSNYSDFKNKGYTYSYLEQFRDALDTSLIEKLNKIIFYFQAGNTELLREHEGPVTAEIFWNIFNNSKRKKTGARICCTISYFLGLSFICIVLVQNVFFVFQAIF